uniref:Uncharacterized protein n=1 Tax=Rhizophora mucronata TaxID=61149 RepID=A0A2P2JMA6_RHIMU
MISGQQIFCAPFTLNTVFHLVYNPQVTQLPCISFILSKFNKIISLLQFNTWEMQLEPVLIILAMLNKKSIHFFPASQLAELLSISFALNHP